MACTSAGDSRRTGAFSTAYRLDVTRRRDQLPGMRSQSQPRRHSAAVLIALALTVLVYPQRASAQGTAVPAVRSLRASDVDTMRVREDGVRMAYGKDSLQFGDLRMPRETRGVRVPLVILIHGGCWFSPYASLRNTAPLAQAITDAGVATWNVEYRRYDQPGGGWPGTFRDAADAADFVRTLATRYVIDTTRIIAAGHSAGGHLALWLATRRTLTAQSPLAGGKPLALRGVVSIAGIADLREFYGREKSTCGNTAVESLLGGAPDDVVYRLRDASPIDRLPLGVPSIHIAGDRDFIAPTFVREAYATAARVKGDSVTIETVPNEGHFEAIAPMRATGRAVVAAILRLLAPSARH